MGYIFIIVLFGCYLYELIRANHHKKWHKHYMEIAAQCEQELDRLYE